MLRLRPEEEWAQDKLYWNVVSSYAWKSIYIPLKNITCKIFIWKYLEYYRPPTLSDNQLRQIIRASTKSNIS